MSTAPVMSITDELIAELESVASDDFPLSAIDTETLRALLAERAELKSRVATMTGLLGDAEDELDSLAGMMEPYYSQCNADDDARRLIERIRAVLPPPYIPPPPPAITCQQCSGWKSKRVFIDDAALRNHTRSAHAMQAAK